METINAYPNFASIQNLVERADAVAEFFHRGQFRFDGITPYITHPRAVAALLTDPVEKQVALLHDLLEDTNCTTIDLFFFGFSVEVVEAVEIMTKVKGIDYDAYLVRVKSNRLSKRVKEKDMLINLSDEPTKNQVKKYSKGLIYLLA
jgi:(p)ppGpp synthase/HD superfamily hydrolase